MGAPPSSSLSPRESESGGLSPAGRDTEITELRRDGGWEPIRAYGNHRIEDCIQVITKSLGQIVCIQQVPQGLNLGLAPNPTVGGRYQINICLLEGVFSGGLPPRGSMEVTQRVEGVFSSVQFSSSVLSDSLRPQGLQYARPPCPSPTPGVYSNSCPLSW